MRFEKRGADHRCDLLVDHYRFYLLRNNTGLRALPIELLDDILLEIWGVIYGVPIIVARPTGFFAIPQGMIFELLPPVAFVASQALAAPAHLQALECFCFIPVWTGLWIVRVLAGRPSEILDVVGIHARLPIVATYKQTLLAGVGAPDSLVLINHKVHSGLLLMDELDGDLGPAVGEGAEILVFALGQIVRVFLAELAFITTRVVELLDFVMGLRTIVAQSAGLMAFAQHVLVVDVRPASVLGVVVVQAGLEVVRVYVMAYVHSQMQLPVLKVLRSNLKNSPPGPSLSSCFSW